MLRKLLVILSLIMSIGSLSQDPDLEGTWYLYNMYSEFFYIDTNDVNPPITPFITFNEDYSFTGAGACNTFEGALEYNSAEDTFTVISFTETQETCEFFDHTEFENTYFEYFFVGETFFYFLENDPEGFTKLQLDIPIFAGMRFRNILLDIGEEQADKTTIYPNPVKDNIYVNTNFPLEKIEIYSMHGKLLLSDRSLKSLDVSNLTSGIYFIKIISDKGILTKKFIKN